VDTLGIFQAPLDNGEVGADGRNDPPGNISDGAVGQRQRLPRYGYFELHTRQRRILRECVQDHSMRVDTGRHADSGYHFIGLQTLEGEEEIKNGSKLSRFLLPALTQPC
jgi:hypothetical protein